MAVRTDYNGQGEIMGGVPCQSDPWEKESGQPEAPSKSTASSSKENLIVGPLDPRSVAGVDWPEPGDPNFYAKMNDGIEEAIRRIADSSMGNLHDLLIGIVNIIPQIRSNQNHLIADWIAARCEVLIGLDRAEHKELYELRETILMLPTSNRQR